MHHFSQPIPVNARRPVIELRHINRAEVARVVEMERLLRARIGRIDRPH